ncbi:hypothetical protein KUTeg_019906 [Tegillarca granosa]|uniref:RanBP2-type domain-containing protein n=1 Tax=Tegillarca granosa TaxID=220873 RepID=A0ABQ9EJD6_TEGGR|nr:hypothetical protein KUTeg_019906 [Tegillarca granosa]
MATADGHICLSGELDQFMLAACRCEILFPEPKIPGTLVSSPPKKSGVFSRFRKSKKIVDNKENFSNLYSIGKCYLNLLKLFDKGIKIIETDSEKSVTLKFELNNWINGELDYVIKDPLWHEVTLNSGAIRRPFVLHFEAGSEFDAFYKQLKEVFKELEYSKSKNTDLTETYSLVAFKCKTENSVKKSNIYTSLPDLHHNNKQIDTEKCIGDKLSTEPSENKQDNSEAQKSPVSVPVPFTPALFKSPLSENNDKKVFTFDEPVTEKYQKNLCTTSSSLQSPPSLNTLLNNITSSKCIENRDLKSSVISSQSDYMTMIMEKADSEHWKKIGHLLATAICSGEKQHAQEYAALLAEHKIKVSVEVDTSALISEPKDAEIRLKMFMKHKFPVEVQRWIIGQRIPKDNETLRHCNVKTTGTVVYLYLVSAKSVGLNREEVESRHAQQILPQDYIQMTMGQPYSPQTPQSNISSSSQQGNSRSRSMHSPGGASTLQQGKGLPMQRQQQIPLQKGQSIPNIPVQGQGQNQTGQRVPQVHSDPNVGTHQQRLQGKQPAKATSSPREESEIGWQCPACTYINLPTRPGCEICSGDRPKSYVIPKDYQLREEEKARIKQELEMEHQVQQVAKTRRPEETTDEDVLGDMNEGDLDALLRFNDAMQIAAHEHFDDYGRPQGQEHAEDEVPPPLRDNYMASDNIQTDQRQLENLRFPLDIPHSGQPKFNNFSDEEN